MAYNVVTAGGATGEQHTQHSLGIVEITDNSFNLYVQDAELVSGTYGFFGWAWVRLQPVTPPDTTINLWEDDHQDPDLVTSTNPADLVVTDGQWTEFLYTVEPPLSFDPRPPPGIRRLWTACVAFLCQRHPQRSL